MRATTKLRHLIEKGLVVAPGVFDGLSARLVQMAGFEAAYASGGAIARSIGVPDIGIVDVSQNVGRLQQITEVVDIPVIADLDTGYGNALNARRAARAFERAGVAAFHIEDQTFPKRCGHLDDKAVVPAPEFAGKLKAVRDALRDDDFVVVARTDAIAVEGFERAMERAHAYAAAGADAIFVEAPESIEQIEEVARRLKLPKLINMFHGGKTPLVDAAVLRELGYSIVIMPSDLQRAAVRSMQLTLQAIREDGHSARRAPDMISFAERDAIVDTAGLLALGDRFARG